MWVNARAGLTPLIPADVLLDCPEVDSSAWLGHSPDTDRSDGVTSSEPAAQAHRCPVHGLAGACHPPKRKEQMTMTTIARRITGGVDTHLDTHVAAALDERGAQLGVQSFPATAAGYRELLDWLEGFGTVELIGVEGTGSYGAGLTRHLLGCHVTVVEIDRPNRQRRRRTGKSDPHDAVAAARAAQGSEATGSAKTRDGNVEAMRVLRVARRSARAPGPRSSTRCAASSRPLPRSSGPSCGISPSTESSP